jgi:hypothetical protein
MDICSGAVAHREHLVLASGFSEQRGGVVLPDLKTPIRRFIAIKRAVGITLFLLACLTLGVSQKTQQDDGSPPKYDFHTETKTKGVVSEIKLVPFGARKDFTTLIIKSGDDTVNIYLCPKPFQEEMGISFSKGDEIAVTGSKVKQDASDVILARELVKGTDTLLFRDDKGHPVWDWRTGK